MTSCSSRPATAPARCPPTGSCRRPWGPPGSASRLGDGVELVGEVGGSDKIDLLGSAMCLLNPLRWAEPFGMVMIESLACGTPVVATALGSVPEIVDDGVTGFVRSTEAQLVEVERIDRQRCREAVARRFSTARMVADHLHLYGSVARGRPRLRPVV